MIRDARFHCGSDFQAPMNPHEVVPREVERDGSLQVVVLQLSENSKRATGWIDQPQSHAATSNSLLMN